MVPESLIQQYGSGNLIPIIGCELFTIDQPGFPKANIHDYIISRQFRASAEFPTPPDNFYELQLMDDKLNQNVILGYLNNIRAEEKDTTLLEILAKMKKFRLFIMTSMFKDFEQILSNSNPGEEFDILKNDSNNSSGLTNINFKTKKRKIVYLFDNEESPMFAINEEERLEYLFSLAKTSAIKDSLLNFLSGKTLLFMGCDFSDWFMRYCIRVLYNQPYEKGPRVYIVNDATEPLNFQFSFFRKHKIELIHQYPVKDFINELFDKIMATQDFEDLFRGKKVFLSYSKHDKDIAIKMYKYLRNQGVNVWYDENDKEIGAHKRIIQQQIMDPVETSAMICIISSTLIDETKNNNQSSYIRDIEWDTAEVRIKGAQIKNETDKFGVVPYFVDDHKPYQQNIPKFIGENFRFGELLGGCEKLFNEIKKYLQ